MRALIVYESMYGNTHVVANHIAEGLRPQFDVDVVPVEEATPERIAGADLLVVGGPTHVHSMSSEKSRKAAKDSLSKPGPASGWTPMPKPRGFEIGSMSWPHVENRGRGSVRHPHRRVSRC